MLPLLFDDFCSSEEKAFGSCLYKMSWAMRKHVLCHMRTTKAQISLRINKGADQPAHPRSLISAFVVRCLDSVMSLVCVTKLSSLMLASVTEQASLSLTWSETPDNTFSHDEAQINNHHNSSSDKYEATGCTGACPYFLLK